MSDTKKMTLADELRQKATGPLFGSGGRIHELLLSAAAALEEKDEALRAVWEVPGDETLPESVWIKVRAALSSGGA